MNQDILDDEFVKKEPIKKENWRFFLVPIIMWVLILADFVGFPHFQFQLLMGYVSLAAVTILLFVKRDFGLIALFVLLLMGIFGFVNQYTWTIELHVGVSFGLLHLVLFITQYSILPSGFVPTKLGGNKKYQSVKQPTKEERLKENRFMRTYYNKTDSELQVIVESSQYSEAAVEAATELLKRRRN